MIAARPRRPPPVYPAPPSRMLSVQHLHKAYGDQVLFEDAGFRMSRGERLGLVGRNGSGKTTLLRLLLGEETPDAGTISVPRDYVIGHLSQQPSFERPTVLDEVLAGLGERSHEERYRAEAALMGLGLRREDLARPAVELSGGYGMRVELARLLVARPHLLLLDEPTNFLDIVSVRWLSRLLRAWPHELIVITHDRRFMDEVTTHVMAIHRHGLRRMEGPVGKLHRQIATEEQVRESARVNEEKKRRQDERFIERFRYKASKARAVQSRIKALERRGRLEALEDESRLAFRFRAAPFHAATMLSAEGLAFAYPDGPTLFEDLDLEIGAGDRIGVVGPNGRGKTTLLELLAGERTPARGTVRAHPATAIASFGRTSIARLDPARTIEEELLAADPSQDRGTVRGLAGLFMFPGEAANKPIGVLSGGERSRVQLARLLVEPANLLLLDEPTNHLDVESIDALVDAVDAFEGAVVLVTHGEGILERLATRLVVFDGGRVSTFEGGYRDFLERVGWRGEDEDAAAEATPRERARVQRRRRAELVAERGRATADLQRRVEDLERGIERLEDEVATHDAAMETAAQQGRHDDLARLAARAKRARAAIDERFEALEQAVDALEHARAPFDARLAELE